MPRRRVVMLVPPRGSAVRSIRVRAGFIVVAGALLLGGFAGYFIPFNHFALDKVKLNEKKNVERVNQDLLQRILDIRQGIAAVQDEIAELTARRRRLTMLMEFDSGQEEKPQRRRATMGGVDELLAVVRSCEKRVARLTASLDSQPSYFASRPILMPVADTPVLSVPFGQRKDPFTGAVKWHNGIDIAAARGTPVLASADGRVVDVDEDKRWGKVVRLRHGEGFATVYAHLGGIEVRRGERVERGEQIGSVGTSGLTTGPHLHYEVRRNGTPFDPEAFFHPSLEEKLLRPERLAGYLEAQ